MEYTSWYAFYSFTFEPIFVFHNAVPNQDYQIIMNFQIVSEVFEGLLFLSGMMFWIFGFWIYCQYIAQLKQKCLEYIYIIYI